jgi:cold shock protein
MKIGTVKVFNETKGFGYITEDGGGDFFVHISGLVDEIKTNDRVIFEVQDGRKGMNAVNVRLTTEPKQ